MVTLPRPTLPVYPFGEPGREIVIHQGDIEILGVGRGVGKISATMNGDLNIKWQVRAWQLSMQYGELLLLHELGYRGQFGRRIPPREWARTREPVPWT